MSKNHFLPFQINTIIFIFVIFFTKWLSETHFRWHFWPFHQYEIIFNFCTKWLPAAILDVRKSLSITYLAISDQCENLSFYCFYKMAADAHFGCPKFIFDGISGHFRSIRDCFCIFLQNGRRRTCWMFENHF